MKIFANKFCLELRADAVNAHFSMELSSLEKVGEALRSGKILFPGQIFYTPAHTDAGWEAAVFALHNSPEAAETEMRLVLLFADETALHAFIRSYRLRFREMAAAGGLVLNEKQEILLIWRYERWDLPKGKVEKGEAHDLAACREVEEETGLRDFRLQGHFADTWHVFPQKDKMILKCTHWYRMFADSARNQELKPQVEEAITALAWKPLAELRMSIPETWPLIQELLREISRTDPG